VGALLAVLVATVVVLRDVLAYDRPEPAPREPGPAREERPARAEHTTVVLGDLVAEDDDERRRRAGAALVLLALTLVAAALVGAGVYQLVVKLG
jgi:hypothetical protein